MAQIKAVFFGSSPFAVPSLKKMLEGPYKICCVVTQPDKEKGRGLHVGGTAVKSIAKQSGLETFQPACVNSAESLKRLSGYKADLFVVIAYGQIFSEELLRLPGIFAVNLHASLLPKYRGAAPINWALIKGERETGVSVMRMSGRMDAGPLILQRKIPVDLGDDAVTLTEKLSREGASLLEEALGTITSNDFTLTPQDEAGVTFAPRLKKEDGLIDWKRDALEVHNLIRGCLSWPGAFSHYRGKLLKIYQSRPLQPSGREQLSYEPGEVVRVAKDGIIVSCASSLLSVGELQLEGKRRMTAQEFIAGHRICPGEKFSNK